MPLQNLNSFHDVRKSGKETIDFDFYDSVMNNNDYSLFNENSSGVRKVDIKPLQRQFQINQEAESKKNTNFKLMNDSDNLLTNCLAYERNNTNGPDSTSSSIASVSSPCLNSFEGETSPINETLSSSTPSSDLTNVTPLPFSRSSSSTSVKDADDVNSYSLDEVSEKTDMKLLADAVETLSLQHKKMHPQIGTFSNTSKVQCRRRRKNMTFTNEQLRKIDRENEILLKKIMSYSKPCSKSTAGINHNSPPLRVKASAAVNRRKNQRQINHDNYILLKKIHNVKPTKSLSNSRNQL